MSASEQAGNHDAAGICRVLHAYDIGFSIDLKRSREKLTSASVEGPHRRDPRAFAFDLMPLSAPLAVEPVKVGRYATLPQAEVLIYDFGAVLVNFTIPFSGPLASLSLLTRELVDNDALLRQSRMQMDALVKTLGDCITKVNVADVVEDYVILTVKEFRSNVMPVDIPVKLAGTLAQVLRAEQDELSPQEVADSMTCVISYSPSDVTVIDWNAAFVIDSDADDVQSVLEFANMELLEMRFLDRKLDQWLDEAHGMDAGRSGTRVHQRAGSHRSMRRVAEMQLDGAILFERVSNAPKLLGDQYLARIYRLASQKFHLAEWNASILRKLDVIESIYEKMSDRVANRRDQLLEWIIIILIAFEIVMPFVKKLF